MEQEELRHTTLPSFVLVVTTAIPLVLTILVVAGFSLSEGVWALHISIGALICFTLGWWSLDCAAQSPRYIVYGVGLIACAPLLFLMWQNPLTEPFAYTFSTAISALATYFVWKFAR